MDNIIEQNQTSVDRTLLADRFIRTQVGSKELVFPAIWVAEILRVDRSYILALPFYDRLLMGIIDRNSQTIPIVDTNKLLGLEEVNLSERFIIVRLDRSDKGSINVGLIIDRLIGNTTRNELPPDLFTPNHSSNTIVMQSDLIPTNLWEPNYSLTGK